MRKLTFIVLCFFFLSAQAQISNDRQLDSRLQTFLSYTKQLDFEKIMDYTHPRLFTIAPKDAMIEAMSAMVKSDEMTISFDSIAVLSVGPIYNYQNTAYRKVTYYMIMSIAFNDSMDLTDNQTATIMQSSFQKGFPGKKVFVDTKNNAVKISGTEIMFAIRDKEITEWMFLGCDKSKPELIRRLYPKQVRDHFKI